MTCTKYRSIDGAGPRLLRWGRRAALPLLVMALAGCASDMRPRADAGGPLVIQKQGSFFAGGRDLRSDTLSSLPRAPASGTVAIEQMYVQYQMPASARASSVTLIHGCCLTGATWESTPDDRAGWAEHFVRRGFATYVVDQVARGRSAMNSAPIHGAKLDAQRSAGLPGGMQVAREHAWSIFRFGESYPAPHADSQFPLQSLEMFWKQMVPDWAYSYPEPNPTVPALNQLAERLGSTVLVSHSQSGIYPFQAYQRSRRGIAAIVSIEPLACPAVPDRVRAFVGLPVLVLWGDHVEESGFWAPRRAQCVAFVAAVNAAGGRASLVDTPRKGLRGNSHMLMQDRNNLAIADLVIDWLDSSGIR